MPENARQTAPEDSPEQKKPPTLLQVIGSVLAAGFGVQSRKNRQRDFARGSPAVFIAVGIACTAAFVLTVYAVVAAVLRQAGY